MKGSRVPVAFLAAFLISGFCTYLLSRQIKQQAAAEARDTVTYVAPSHSLLPGAVLKVEDLTFVAWPKRRELPGASASPNKLIGRVVLYPVDKGQPILDQDLTMPGAGGGLARKITPGMRAVALRSDEVVGISGFLTPGSRLDVLLTYRPPDSQQARTIMLCENAQVIAAGQQIDPDPAGKPVSATVVTLLLSPSDAERAVLGSSEGHIHFVLRNPLDQSLAGQHAVFLAGAYSDNAARTDLIAKASDGARQGSGNVQTAAAILSRRWQVLMPHTRQQAGDTRRCMPSSDCYARVSAKKFGLEAQEGSFVGPEIFLGGDPINASRSRE